MAMQVELVTKQTVRSLVEMRERSGILRFPKEYQRGQAWKTLQKQLFVDSVFRGYSIPAFYFHFCKESKLPGSTETWKEYAVIDGQQRIRALHEFVAGGFKLPHSAGFKFPVIVGEGPRPWEGLGFSELHGDLEGFKNEFLKQPVVIYEIVADDENEIRDLFIRLQGGTPLSAQDKRDAWPGKFTEFVLNLGGKDANDDDDVGYPGHDFFQKYVRDKDGGRKRQLAAQVAMLLINRWERDAGKIKEFCSTDSRTLDEFYRQHVAFNLDGESARKLKRVLDKLVSAFESPPKKKLVGHEAIHLALLMDSLTDGYARGWESALYPQFTEFRKRVAEAVKKKKGTLPSQYAEYEDKYGKLTKANAADASSIETRHVFFSRKMREMLPLTPLHDKRQIDLLAQDVVYIRDEGKCQWCEMKRTPHKVDRSKAEFHHVIRHRAGGLSDTKNVALVAAEHHPQRKEEEEEFRRWWQEEKFPPPE